MIETDKAQFAKVVLGFAEIKGKQLSLAAVDLYWMAMQNWSIENFKQAAVLLLQRCEYMPTPKDFEDLRKASPLTAGEAFALAVKRCGSAIQCGQVTMNGTCGDPFVDAVVRAIGGYGAIAMCDHDKLHYLERRFSEHYETMRNSEDIREEVPQIAGPRRTALNGPRSIQDLHLKHLRDKAQ